MKNKGQNINYKAFVPVGVTFIGVGVTFMVAVNPAIGAGLIAVGVAYMVIGARRSKDNQNHP